ncbi:hypothetical protein Tco_1457799, partial [Tanacetum coccineum]
MVNVQNLNLQRWIRCDYMGTCWILNSMVTELSEAFLYAQSAYELWKEIVERYGQSNGPLIYQLERELSKITQEDKKEQELQLMLVMVSGETPSDVRCENEIEMGQNGNVDQRLVVAACLKMMKMFKGKGIIDDSGGSIRNYASTSSH